MSVFSFAQDGNIEEADRILNSARESIYKGVNQGDVKGFYLNKGILPSINGRPSFPSEKTVWISGSAQIRLETKNFLPQSDDSQPSYMKTVTTANEERVRVDSYRSFYGGKEELVDERDAMR